MSHLIRLFCVLFAITIAGPAAAENYASADEAVALVKKAVAAYKSDGKDKAFAAFDDQNGGYQVKDLYIFVQDMQGNMLAHGKNKGLVGKDLSKLKDADGKLFVAEMIKVAQSGAPGWVDYKWVNPASKKIQAKSSYIEPVDGLYIGAGIYK